MRDLSRKALLVGALGQLAVPALPALGWGVAIGERATADGIPPELPLGPFFSIWGVIFIGYLVVAVLANWRPRHVTDRLAAPLAAAAFGNMLWMLSAQMLGWASLDLLLIVPILFCAWEASYRLDRIGGFDGTGHRVLVCMVSGLLSGWLAVALSISLPKAAREALDWAPSDQVWWSLWMALIPAAILAAVFANRISKSLWFFAALLWGLSGLILNNWWRTETHALAIAALILGWIILSRRLRFGAKGSA